TWMARSPRLIGRVLVDCVAMRIPQLPSGDNIMPYTSPLSETRREFLTLEEVAQLFRVSRRTMQKFIRDHPFYRTLGRRKIFSQADVVRLYEALACPSNLSLPARARRRTGRSAAPTSADTLTEALKLASGD